MDKIDKEYSEIISNLVEKVAILKEEKEEGLQIISHLIDINNKEDDILIKCDELDKENKELKKQKEFDDQIIAGNIDMREKAEAKNIKLLKQIKKLTKKIKVYELKPND